MRTNISEVWESIWRHVQNRRLQQIWSQFRPLSGQVASRGWIWGWEGGPPSASRTSWKPNGARKPEGQEAMAPGGQEAKSCDLAQARPRCYFLLVGSACSVDFRAKASHLRGCQSRRAPSTFEDL